MRGRTTLRVRCIGLSRSWRWRGAEWHDRHGIGVLRWRRAGRAAMVDGGPSVHRRVRWLLGLLRRRWLRWTTRLLLQSDRLHARRGERHSALHGGLGRLIGRQRWKGVWWLLAVRVSGLRRLLLACLLLLLLLSLLLLPSVLLAIPLLHVRSEVRNATLEVFHTLDRLARRSLGRRAVGRWRISVGRTAAPGSTTLRRRVRVAGGRRRLRAAVRWLVLR